MFSAFRNSGSMVAKFSRWLRWRFFRPYAELRIGATIA